MIIRYLHIEGRSLIPQIFGRQYSAFLPDEQRGGVSVASDIVRTNTQISDLEALYAVNVEAFVEDAVFDDGVSFAGCHGTCAEGVPGSFYVACRRG
jgi:hypothetical protein